MSFLGEDVPGLIKDAFWSRLGDVTLHLRGEPIWVDGHLSYPSSDVPTKGFLDDYQSSDRAVGVPRDHRRVTILGAGLGADPNIDDRLSLGGLRYVIHAVSRDPAGATWELQVSPEAEL